MRIISLVLLALLMLTLVSAETKVQSASGNSTIVVPCKINFRRNPQGVCIPVEQCCKDDTCRPLYIARPICKTRIRKITIPYAIFRRYPYSKLKECPKGFRRINKKQCISIIKTVGRCPVTYFRVNRKTCLKLVTVVTDKSTLIDFWKIKCGLGQKKINGKCVQVSKKINIDLIQESNQKFFCPKGYKRVGRFKCIKVLLCPKGYKKTQFGCKKVKIQCPPGYKRIFNTCTKVEKCKKGYFKVKGKCVKFTRNICRFKKCPKIKCTKGFYQRLFKGTCCPQCVRCKCSKFFDPVCSTNGVTFRNKCDAICQGFKIKHRGTCNKPCNGRCPSFIKPVCGRDGKTYRNRCVLRSNLVEFAHNGKCKAKVVKDPKDKKVKTVKTVKVIKKTVKTYNIKNEIKLCTLVQKYLVNKIKKINIRITKANKKKQTKVIKRLNSFHKQYVIQYNNVLTDCKKQKRITKVNRFIITEMLSQKYRFKNRWLFNYKKITKQQEHIKDKQLVKFTQKLEKCRAKSLRYKKKWNNYFQVRRRAQIERVNKAKSASVKKYLRRSYEKYTQLYKNRIRRGLKRLNKRCRRIVRRRDSFIRRFMRNLRKTSVLKKRVEKYRSLLKNKLTLSKRTYYNNKLQAAEKRLTKFFENIEKRAFLRQRRSCIRKYARTVRRVNNYRKRQLRIIRIQNERRLRADKRLKNFCKKYSKNFNKCYNNAKAKRDTKRRAKDAKKDAKRKKVALKLQNKINNLKVKCDKLHQRALPFIKNNKKKETQFPKKKKKYDN